MKLSDTEGGRRLFGLRTGILSKVETGWAQEKGGSIVH